jgi:hypothetical protein
MQVSTTVLRRVVRCLPALRDKLVGAFAAFVVRIQVCAIASYALSCRCGCGQGEA